ncbi:MAG: D-alanine--D-alanine ligase [Pseudomonadota bacterium]
MSEHRDRVAVLMGGQSAEREISLLSGQAVLNALRDAGIEAVGIDAGPDLPMQLKDEAVDRVFNILHGRGGEDGQVQGLLELMGLPYTGSGVLASALAMDKIRSKQLWQYAGLPTPYATILESATDWKALIDQYGEMVVKPVHEGSSIGMYMVDSARSLEQAWHAAGLYDTMVMAERRVRGPEFTVAILNDQVLPAIELATDREFYTYEAKYMDNDTRYQCPANLTDKEDQELASLCLEAFRVLGCRTWGRVDVMRDADGQFQLLEINTVPGMTDHSLVPIAARQAGHSFEQLVLAILASAKVGRKP